MIRSNACTNFLFKTLSVENDVKCCLVHAIKMEVTIFEVLHTHLKLIFLKNEKKPCLVLGDGFDPSVK